MPHYDIIIIGGGPAGSTVASLVKRYTPQARILLLEKTHFPRHHVGESLLAGASPILEEMGVYDKVSQHGFLQKLGATFVWGRDRQPWGFEFDGIVEKLARQGKRLPEIYTKAWQVKRSEYDHILLKHAEELGVEVKQGSKVQKVLRADDQRVIGVEYKTDRSIQSASSTWVIDCSGQDALLGRELNLRQYDERMNNYALFGYWKGAKWKHEYLGHPNFTRIFIATTPRGWLWYIPMSREIVSVGFVTHRQTLKQQMTEGPEKLYREELAACPEIQGLLDQANLTRLSPDQGRQVVAIQDWSYISKKMAGPGWAMVGDAAGFVDPILSSGVMLAHECGQKAAYALNSSLASNDEALIERYWKFYQDTYHSYLQAYRDMAAFWYSNNFSMESWLWEAQRTLVQRESRIDLNDRGAFVRVASGYATRAESLSLFGSYPLHEAQQLVDGLFGVSAGSERLEAAYEKRPLRLKPEVQVTEGMYFYDGQIRQTVRILNTENQQYLDLHPAEEILLKLVDGQHGLADLNEVSQRIQSMETRMPIRNGIDFAIQLDGIGALVAD